MQGRLGGLGWEKAGLVKVTDKRPLAKSSSLPGNEMVDQELEMPELK